jgi:hypothetical protein
VATAPYRYRTHDEDSARWLGFAFRPGDIVISTRRRSGTTWMQMICALLIFQRPELPAPLFHLSPWLDHTIVPGPAVHAMLAGQAHRRFIKTHTPLDALPLDPRVSYIVTARHPLDVFVSLHHQLHGEPPTSDLLVRWIAGELDPSVYPESLPRVMWHLSDAWARRFEPNVLLIHYDDLAADLAGQMRGLAWRLGIPVPEPAWPALIRAATFDRMRNRADRLVPAAPGMPADSASFFRRGTSGAGRELLSVGEIAAYHARAAQLAPPDLLAWLHR